MVKRAGKPRNPLWLDRDAERGELTNPAGQDIVVISGSAFRAIFAGSKELFGTGGDVIWYNGGRSAGEADGRSLRRAGTMQPGRLLSLVAEVYTELGWGKVSYADLDETKKVATVLIENGPFVRGVKSDSHVCAFVRGFLEGLVSVSLDSETKVDEQQCVAAGAEHCVFRLSWK